MRVFIDKDSYRVVAFHDDNFDGFYKKCICVYKADDYNPFLDKEWGIFKIEVPVLAEVIKAIKKKVKVLKIECASIDIADLTAAQNTEFTTYKQSLKTFVNGITAIDGKVIGKIAYPTKPSFMED